MLELQATQNSILGYEKRNPGTTTYHRSAVVEVNGDINLAIFKQAITTVMQRHDILRMKLVEQETNTTFSIIPDNELPNTPNWPLQVIDASTLPDSPPDKLVVTLRTLKQQHFIEKPFDFYAAPMWRAALINMGDQKFQFALLFHHIIVDEHAIGVILRDISTYYNAALNNTTPELIEIPPIESINITPDINDKNKRLAYWKENLKDLNTIKLQSDKRANTAFHFSGERIPFKIGSQLVQQLKLAMPGYSINTILLATLYTLLYRYSGETDACIGITSANRRHDQHVSRLAMDNLVNAYFNSIPLRLTFDKDASFNTLLPLIQNAVKMGLNNQMAHDEIFHHAVSNATRSSLVTATPFNFLLVTNPVKPTLALQNTSSSRVIELDLGHCKFENFGINCDELTDGSYECFIEYNNELFEYKSISRLIGHFSHILQGAAANPSEKLADIPIISADEMQLVREFNNTNKPPVYTGSVADFLHSAAINAPTEKTALVFHHQNKSRDTLSYGELEIYSNKLASYMTNIHHSNDQQIVGICLSRSLRLITTTIASIKAGHAIVMMDPTQIKMLDAKMSSAKPAFVLVDNNTKHLFANYTVDSINIDDPKSIEAIDNSDHHYNSPTTAEKNTAYIMYTSGSTDKPKAVKCTHAALLNLINSQLADQNHKPGTKVLCTSLPTFDGFFYDILVAMATGGELHLSFDKGRLSPEILSYIISTEKIDFAALLSDVLHQLDPSLPLSYVISMGNMAHEDTLKNWALAGKKVENDIGHTETGIHLSTHRYEVGDDYALIGKPVRNMKMIILDSNGCLCPANVPGELYVAGPGLADCYMNDPELTNQKFKHAKFDDAKQRYIFCDSADINTIRLYATGDYGCYQLTHHGELEVKFIGRRDDQLKLHGVRVEMNAVRNALSRHPLIKNVIITPNSNKTSLVAYVLPTSNDISLDEMRADIRRFLATTSLPTVAYPQTIRTLNFLPLTANGKIDYLALPKLPELKLLPMLSPRSKLQLLLKSLWIKVLEKFSNEQIDCNVSFRELGGDSLSLATLETILNRNKELRELIKLPDDKHIGIETLSLDMTILELETSLRKMAMPLLQYTSNPYLLYAAPNPPKSTETINNTSSKLSSTR